MLAMAFGYFSVRAGVLTPKWQKEFAGKGLHQILEVGSRPWVILGLYGVGLAARVYAVNSGAAFWLYSSPIFDDFAARDSSALGTVAGVVAEFCPLCFAAMLALQSRQTIGRTSRHVVSVVVTFMLAVEVLYYSFTAYKFGLIGTVLILIIVGMLYGKNWLRRSLILGLLFITVVLPIVNSIRLNFTSYYKTSIQNNNFGTSSDLFNKLDVATTSAYSDNSSFDGRYFLDPFFFRLNGAEALAVAEKYTPAFGYYFGRTYVNLFTLMVPRPLRPGSGEPQYINWAVDYVGLSPTNPTVMPLPTIVEAYLNFGVPGVILVMFLLGIFFRYMDLFSVNFSRHVLGVGLFSYAAWRCLNIEHYLFIFLPAMLKTVAVVLIICSFLRLVLVRKRGITH